MTQQDRLIAEAEAKGRAAERALIVMLIRARADNRHAQIEYAKAVKGDWQAVYAKASEADAIADGIEALPDPTSETTP